MKFTKQDVQIINQETVYQGFFSIKKYDLKHRLFGGGWSNEISREVFCRGHAVGVLLYDPDRDNIVLSEQFRAAALDDPESPWLFEIVAGIIEADESLEQVAKREAKEEAACELHELIPIHHYFSSPGGSSETIQLFLGKVNSDGMGGVHGAKNEDEDIRVHVISRSESLKLLEAGKIKNALAIIALQWLQLHLQEVQKRWK